MSQLKYLISACILAITVGSANASSLLADGAFLNPIGLGACGVGNWCDWSSVGITRSSAASFGISGDYASLPNTSTNGADLFQWMTPLTPGTYTLSFLAQNASPWSAELVFGLNQQGGATIPFVFGAGWETEITLAPSSSFALETLTFTLTGSEPYTPNEITFSQSYDAAIDQVSNSKNPSGTIINIADVSLTATPLPAALPLFASGLGVMGLFGWRRKRKSKTVAA